MSLKFNIILFIFIFILNFIYSIFSSYKEDYIINKLIYILTLFIVSGIEVGIMNLILI